MPPKVNVNVELQNLNKLILEIKTDLQNKATSSKLDELLLEIRAKDVKIEILESQVAVLQNTVKLLSAKCDGNEQYSRRVSLRINNIPLPANDEDEIVDDVLVKVRNLFDEAEVNMSDNCIDRVHRVGKLIVGDDGARKQQLIVKFTTWRHRTRFYRSRKKLSAAKIYLDLTQAKFKLLTSSQEKVRGNTVVDFVFANVNCALCARMTNGNFKFFSSQEQLDKILGV